MKSLFLVDPDVPWWSSADCRMTNPTEHSFDSDVRSRGHPRLELDILALPQMTTLSVLSEISTRTPHRFMTTLVSS